MRQPLRQVAGKVADLAFQPAHRAGRGERGLNAAVDALDHQAVLGVDVVEELHELADACLGVIERGVNFRRERHTEADMHVIHALRPQRPDTFMIVYDCEELQPCELPRFYYQWTTATGLAVEETRFVASAQVGNERREELLGKRADRRSSNGLARAGSFENIAFQSPLNQRLFGQLARPALQGLIRANE